MTRAVALRELCHSRAGDKSDSVTLSVIPYDPNHYEVIRSEVTADRVHQHFADLIEGGVQRFEMPHIAALNFVLDRALGGGCTRSLRIDPHGKILGGAVLDMAIRIPDELVLPRLGPAGYEADPTSAPLPAPGHDPPGGGDQSA